MKENKDEFVDMFYSGIQSIAILLKDCFKDLLSEFSRTGENLQDSFLESYFSKPSRIEAIMRKINIIGSFNCDQSLDKINSAFPSFASKQYFERKPNAIFFGDLEINENDVKKVALLRLFIDICKGVFLESSLKDAKDIRTIVDGLYAYMTDNSLNETEAQYRIIAAKKWSYVFQYLSHQNCERITELCVDLCNEVTDSKNNSRKNPNYRKILNIKLCLLAKCEINGDFDENYLNDVIFRVTMFNRCDGFIWKSLSEKYYKNGAEFSLNLIRNIFTISNPVNKTKIIMDGLKKVIPRNHQNVSHPVFRGSIMGYLIKSDISQYLTTIDTEIQNNLLTGSILSELAAFIQTSQSSDRVIIEKVYNIVSSHFLLCSNFEKELINFLFSIHDKSSEYFLEIYSKKNANFKSLLIHVGYKVFLKYRNPIFEEDSNSIKFFKDIAYDIIKSNCEKSLHGPPLYKVGQLYDSFCPKSKITDSCYDFASCFLPTPYIQKDNSDHIISSWIKTKKPIPIQPTKLSIYNGSDIIPDEAYAMYIVSMNPPDISLIPTIFYYLYSKNAVLSAAVQVYISNAVVDLYENLGIEGVINSIVDFMIPKSIITPYNLFVSLSFLTKLVLSLKFAQFPPITSLFEFIQQIIIVSFCTSSSEIRSEAWNLMDTLHIEYPSICVLSSHLYSASTHILTITKMQYLSFVESEEIRKNSSIKISHIVSSNNEVLYGFFLGSFSRSLAEATSEKITDTFIKLVGEMSQNTKSFDLPGFIVYSTIFLGSFQQVSSDIDRLMLNIRAIPKDDSSSFCALFSNMNSVLLVNSVSQYLLQQEILQPILFALQIQLRNKSIILDGSSITSIFDLLNRCLSLFKVFVTTSDKDDKYEVDFSESNLRVLVPFLDFSQIIFNKLLEIDSEKSKGYFPIIPIVENPKIKVNPSPWFVFLGKISVCDNLRMKFDPLLETFMQLFTIDENYDFVKTYITKHPSSKLLSKLLRRTTSLTMANIVSGIRNPKNLLYFHGLAGIFENVNGIEFLRHLENNSSELIGFDSITKSITLNAGSLISFSFYHLINSDNDNDTRYSSFIILKSICLGLSIMYTNSNLVSRVIMFFEKYSFLTQTKLHDVTFEPAKELSKLIADGFSFCSEQVVFEFLGLLKHDSRIGDLLVYWLNRMCFTPPNPFLDGTFEAFRSLTAKEFIFSLFKLENTENALDIIRSIVTFIPGKSKEFVELFLIFLLLCFPTTGEKNDEKTIIYILFLFYLKQDVVLSYLFNCLSYSYSFFTEFSYGQLDLVFNANDYFKEIKDEDEIYSYNDFLYNIINVLIIIAKENVQCLKCYLSQIIVFYQINDKVFQELPKKLLGIVFPKFFSDPNITFEILKAENDEFSYRNCLAWGLVCGNLELATRAIKLFLDAYEIKDESEIIRIVIRVLNYINQCLIDKKHKRTIKQIWVFKIFVSSEDPNYAIILSYIQCLLELLHRAVIKSSTSFIEAFWVSYDMIRIANNTVPVINASLKVMIAETSKLDTITQLNLYEPDPGFIGIIDLISGSKSDAETQDLFLSLIKICEVKNLAKIALSSYSDWRSFIHIVSSVVNRSPQYSDSELDFSRIKMETVHTIIKCFGKLLQKFDQNTINIQTNAVFMICVELLKSQSDGINASTIQPIIDAAVEHKDCVYAAMFLEKIQYLHLQLNDIALKVDEINYINIDNDYIKSFSFDSSSSISSFPPMFLLDEGLYGCVTQRTLYEFLKRIKVFPFEDWLTQIYKMSAEVLSDEKNTDLKIEIRNISFFRDSVEEYQKNPLNKSQQIGKKDSDPTAIQQNPAQIKPMKSDFFIHPTDSFIPDSSSFNTIIAPYLK